MHARIATDNGWPIQCRSVLKNSCLVAAYERMDQANVLGVVGHQRDRGGRALGWGRTSGVPYDVEQGMDGGTNPAGFVPPFLHCSAARASSAGVCAVSA